MKAIKFIKAEKNHRKHRTSKYIAFFEIDRNEVDIEIYTMGFNSNLIFNDYNTGDGDIRNQRAKNFLTYKVEVELRENPEYKFLFEPEYEES